MTPESKLQRPTDETTARELAGMKAEPLLPAEKKLILGSIGLGLVLLGILLWVSGKYFPH